MTTVLRRLYELGGLSLVGCLTSVAVAFLFRAIAAKPSVTSETDDTAVATPTPRGSGEPLLDTASEANAGFGKYLKLIAVLLAVELFKEVCGEQEGGEQRTALDRALRVLRLESFRESLRGLAQGRGLPPLPAAGKEDEDKDEDKDEDEDEDEDAPGAAAR
eukprot:scaffold12312_cov63-Phaeocystis_antarctica.AAC.5